MIGRIALLVTIPILILILSVSAIAAELGSGAVEGQVINGTEGGNSTAYQNITLKTYLDDTEVGLTNTTTNAEGEFRFDGLSTESVYDYQISLEYQGAEYSEWLWFEENETTKSANVTVYDATTSDEAIKVAMSHMIVYVEEGSLGIVEYFVFVNEGDRAYVGSGEPNGDGNEETLRFSLPRGATEIQSIEGLMECCMVITEEGLIDTMPLTPGTKEVSFSYRIKPSSGTFTLSRVVHYPMTTFNLLVEDKSLKVASDQLTVEEPLDIGDTRFIYLSGDDLAPGATLEARISGLPYASNQGTLKLVAVGLIVLAAGFVFGYLLIRKSPQSVSPEVVDAESNLEQRKQRLLLEIAQLDDDFSGGNIPQEMYQRMRAEKKTQLVKLMRQLKGEGNGEQ